MYISAARLISRGNSARTRFGRQCLQPGLDVTLKRKGSGAGIRSEIKAEDVLDVKLRDLCDRIVPRLKVQVTIDPQPVRCYPEPKKFTLKAKTGSVLASRAAARTIFDHIGRLSPKLVGLGVSVRNSGVAAGSEEARCIFVSRTQDATIDLNHDKDLQSDWGGRWKKVLQPDLG